MAGGYGGGPWGDGAWGGSPFTPLGDFASPLYPIPLGRKFGAIPPKEFSGEPTEGPLSGAAGLLFFSPSLLVPSAGNEIDVDSIDLSVTATDVYEPPVQENSRNFRFGPNSTSRTNNFLYRSQPRAYTAFGVMVQTIPPGPTTLFRVM